MFEEELAPIDIPAVLETVDYSSAWDNDDDGVASSATLDELNSGWTDVDRHVLPDLASFAPGPYLLAVLSAVDRSRLNGHDLVNVLKARRRLVSHVEAGVQADMIEVAHAAPGDATSEPERLAEAFEFASDEIRAALTLTRRSAEGCLNDALDLCERLPSCWIFSTGGGSTGRRRECFCGARLISKPVRRGPLFRSWPVTRPG